MGFEQKDLILELIFNFLFGFLILVLLKRSL